MIIRIAIYSLLTVAVGVVLAVFGTGVGSCVETRSALLAAQASATTETAPPSGQEPSPGLPTSPGDQVASAERNAEAEERAYRDTVRRVLASGTQDQEAKATLERYASSDTVCPALRTIYTKDTARRLQQVEQSIAKTAFEEDYKEAAELLKQGEPDKCIRFCTAKLQRYEGRYRQAFAALKVTAGKAHIADQFDAAKTQAAALLERKDFAGCIARHEQAGKLELSGKQLLELTELIKKAKKAWDDHDFEVAMAVASDDERQRALRAYCEKHPQGRHTRQARVEYDKIEQRTTARQRVEVEARRSKEREKLWTEVLGRHNRLKQLVKDSDPRRPGSLWHPTRQRRPKPLKGLERGMIARLADFLTQYPAAPQCPKARTMLIEWCWVRFANNVDLKKADMTPKGVMDRTGRKLFGEVRETEHAYVVIVKGRNGRLQHRVVPKEPGVQLLLPGAGVAEFNSKLIALLRGKPSASDIAGFGEWSERSGFAKEAENAFLLAGYLAPDDPDTRRKLRAYGYVYKKRRWVRAGSGRP